MKTSPSPSDRDKPESAAYFVQWNRALIRWLYHRTGDMQLAEDLAMQAFFETIRAWPEYKERHPSREFKPLLYHIAKRRWLDYVRKSRTNVELLDERLAEQYNPYALVDYDLEREELLLLVAPHYREVVDMYLQGKRIQDIAVALRYPPAVISRILYKALRRYKELFVMAEFGRGLSLEAVADKFAVTPEHIHKVWYASTQSRRQEMIVRLLAQQFTIDAIALRLGLPLAEVTALRSKASDDHQAEATRTLDRQGWDTRRIADHLDLTVKQVLTWLDEDT